MLQIAPTVFRVMVLLLAVLICPLPVAVLQVPPLPLSAPLVTITRFSASVDLPMNFATILALSVAVQVAPLPGQVSLLSVPDPLPLTARGRALASGAAPNADSIRTAPTTSKRNRLIGFSPAMFRD